MRAIILTIILLLTLTPALSYDYSSDLCTNKTLAVNSCTGYSTCQKITDTVQSTCYKDECDSYESYQCNPKQVQSTCTKQECITKTEQCNCRCTQSVNIPTNPHWDSCAVKETIEKTRCTESRTVCQTDWTKCTWEWICSNGKCSWKRSCTVKICSEQCLRQEVYYETICKAEWAWDYINICIKTICDTCYLEPECTQVFYICQKIEYDTCQKCVKYAPKPYNCTSNKDSYLATIQECTDLNLVASDIKLCQDYPCNKATKLNEKENYYISLTVERAYHNATANVTLSVNNGNFNFYSTQIKPITFAYPFIALKEQVFNIKIVDNIDSNTYSFTMSPLLLELSQTEKLELNNSFQPTPGSNTPLDHEDQTQLPNASFLPALSTISLVGLAYALFSKLKNTPALNLRPIINSIIAGLSSTQTADDKLASTIDMLKLPISIAQLIPPLTLPFAFLDNLVDITELITNLILAVINIINRDKPSLKTNITNIAFSALALIPILGDIFQDGRRGLKIIGNIELSKYLDTYYEQLYASIHTLPRKQARKVMDYIKLMKDNPIALRTLSKLTPKEITEIADLPFRLNFSHDIENASMLMQKVRMLKRTHNHFYAKLSKTKLNLTALPEVRIITENAASYEKGIIEFGITMDERVFTHELGHLIDSIEQPYKKIEGILVNDYPFADDTAAEAIASFVDNNYLRETAKVLNNYTEDIIKFRLLAQKQFKTDKIAGYAYLKLISEKSKAHKFKELFNNIISEELTKEQLTKLDEYTQYMFDQWDEVMKKLR